MYFVVYPELKVLLCFPDQNPMLYHLLENQCKSRIIMQILEDRFQPFHFPLMLLLHDETSLQFYNCIGILRIAELLPPSKILVFYPTM